MYFSSAFVFVLVIVINLSGKVTLQGLRDRNFGMPPNKPRDEILNIGNGSYKTNVVVLEDNPNSAGSNQRGGSQYEGLGNRFGTGYTYKENQPNPRPQLPAEYHHTQVNNNQNPQSSNNGGRTQTQGSAHNSMNNGGTSFVSPDETGVFHVGYGTNNQNQIHTNNRPLKPVAPMNSSGRTLQNQFNNNQNPQSSNSGGRTQTQGSAHNSMNNAGTSFVSPDETGVFHVGYGTNNQNQIHTNNRPLKPVAPMNSSGRTLQNQFNNNQNPQSSNSGGRTQTQGNVNNAWNNRGTSFVSPDGTGIFNVGYGQNNRNQIFVSNRPDQRTAPVNGGRRTTQTQSGKASNNGGYGSKAHINTVFVNDQPIQPDRNDGAWSTYNINDQRIHVLNTGRAQAENQLRILYGILEQILKIKSQLKQEAETLNIKV